MDIFGSLSVPDGLLWLLLVLTIAYLYVSWPADHWKKHGVHRSQLSWYRTIELLVTEPIHVQDMARYNEVGKGRRMFGGYEIMNKVLWIKHPDVLKDVLIKDFNYFPDRRIFPIPKSMKSIRKMLTVLNGNEWKETRNTLTPVFTSGKIRGMMPLILEAKNSLIANFNKAIKNNDTIVSIKPLFRAFTLDVIAECAFSITVNKEQNQDDEFSKHARKLIDRDIPWASLLTIFFPFITYFVDVPVFPEDTIRYFEQSIEHVIQMRKSDPDSVKKRGDFLSIMLDAEEDDAKSNGHQTEQGKTRIRFDHDAVIAQCMLFFLAGSDTTASTLTYAVYLLAQSPECQEKIHAEIDTLMAKNNNTLSYDMLNDFVYVDKVINESLRLYPPAGRTERVCCQDHVVDGVPVPKGTIIAIPIWAIHRDPEHYPDPDKFDPERFSVEAKKERSPYVFIPFGHGPRNCIGMRFALVEAKIAMVEFFRNFTVSVCDQTPTKLVFFKSTGAQGLKTPIYLKITRR